MWSWAVSCVTASRHGPALEGKEGKKRASDVRLAGCDYVVVWLPGAGFLGGFEKGAGAMRGCVVASRG